MEKYFYIYNTKQANFFLQKGLAPIEIGKGRKNDVYIKFIRDKDAEQIFSIWNKNKDMKK